MVTVPPNRHRVPLLLNGPDAESFAAMLEPYGMRLVVLCEPIMSEAAVRRHRWCDESGVQDRFGSDGQNTYREVVEAWAAAGLIRPSAEPTD